MSEPRWIAIDDVIAINKRLLRSTSENHFLRDRSALEGAVHRPRFQAEYRDISSLSWLASCLVQSIGKAHAFEQGNKRTAWLAGRYFITVNGYWLILDAERQESLKHVIEDLIVGDHEPSLLADQLEPLLNLIRS
jgi:death-on-curing protein